MAELSVWERVRIEFACEHEETEVRRRFDRIKRKRYVEQCLRCGDEVRCLRRDSVTGIAVLKIVDFDEALRERWYEQRESRISELLAHADQSRAERDSQWREWYDGYLASREWHNRRVAVLERDRYLCQGCLKKPATQVHHLTYDRVGNEMMFDLISICKDCHDRIPSKFREECHANIYAKPVPSPQGQWRAVEVSDFDPFEEDALP